jgi:hypothetical protein
MSAEQSAVVMLMGATGIRQIDDDTIDEFVRRADLYDTYVGGWLFGIGGEPVAVTRKILTDMMGEHAAVWSDVGLLTPEEFDRTIRLAKAAR